MRNYLTTFFQEYDYPEQAASHLLHVFDTLTQQKEANAVFHRQLDGYGCDAGTFSLLDEATTSLGIHHYTIHLLYLICLSRQMRVRYQQEQLPDAVFHDTILDLKWKLYECYNMHGVWGTFVAEWFERFFRLTRFALGRLQFETAAFAGEYSKHGYALHQGDTVLNIHIPASGPLRHADCLASYGKAASFFKEYFPDKPTAFVCNSWLLFPAHRRFLPSSSNILAFMNDFDILLEEKDEAFGNAWRIFGKEYSGSLADLPQDTSLRKAYAHWIAQGNPVGTGYGVFLYDGGILSPS